MAGVLPSPLLIFTELEEALLDPQAQSFALAGEALAEIERRKIPLVLVSSKTRAELDPVRRKLGHSHPFISESGGGIFLPDGYFNLKIPGIERRSRFLCVPIAKPSSEARIALADLSAATGVSVVSFHDMTARELAQNTGVSARDAELAKQRDFDEVFFFAGATEGAVREFREEAARRKLTVRQSGRFWHISLGTDLTHAVRTLAGLYRSSAPRTRLSAIGLGTGSSAIPLFRGVNQPILLPVTGVQYDPAILKAIPTISRAEHAGPRGWNRAVLSLLAP